MRKVGPDITVGRFGAVVFAAALAVAGATAGAGVANAAPSGSDRPSAMTLAVYGDAPYGTSPTDNSQTLATPAFVDAVNADPDVSSIIHVGDIHSGSQFCTESYDDTIAGLWRHYEDPLVYTPGDNEWADCHKAKEGGHVKDANGNPVDYADGNPAANLALIRSLFFPHAGQTLGGGNLRVRSQAQHADRAHPDDAAYVENVMWSRKGVLFVTVNLPGGSNNDTDPWYGAAETPQQQAQQAAEVRARTGADRRWLAAAFQRAQGDGDRAMVIVTQADMWDPENGAAHLTNYEPFISDIAAAHDRVRQAGASLQRRLARLPLGQPAGGGRPVRHRGVPGGPRRPHGHHGLPGRRRDDAPRLRRAQLPPGRRARQHVPPRVAQADRGYTWATGVR